MKTDRSGLFYMLGSSSVFFGVVLHLSYVCDVIALTSDGIVDFIRGEERVRRGASVYHPSIRQESKLLF